MQKIQNKSFLNLIESMISNDFLLFIDVIIYFTLLFNLTKSLFWFFFTGGISFPTKILWQYVLQIKVVQTVLITFITVAIDSLRINGPGTTFILIFRLLRWLLIYDGRFAWTITIIVIVITLHIKRWMLLLLLLLLLLLMIDNFSRFRIHRWYSVSIFALFLLL